MQIDFIWCGLHIEGEFFPEDGEDRATFDVSRVRVDSLADLLEYSWKPKFVERALRSGWCLDDGVELKSWVKGAMLSASDWDAIQERGLEEGGAL